MASYSVERRHFAAFKEHCKPEFQDEYMRAIGAVLEQYNTTIYENRFIAGGAVELFTAALMRACGIGVTSQGAQITAGDLLLPGGEQLSVKGQFTASRSSVRLVNTQSDETRKVQWKTATLFVISGIGIVYGDPAMTDADNLVTKSDVLELKFKAVRGYMEDDKNVIPMDIPYKPATELTGRSRKASELVAKQVLEELRLKNLQSNLP